MGIKQRDMAGFSSGPPAPSPPTSVYQLFFWKIIHFKRLLEIICQRRRLKLGGQPKIALAEYRERRVGQDAGSMLPGNGGDRKGGGEQWQVSSSGPWPSLSILIQTLIQITFAKEPLQEVKLPCIAFWLDLASSFWQVRHNYRWPSTNTHGECKWIHEGGKYISYDCQLCLHSPPAQSHICIVRVAKSYQEPLDKDFLFLLLTHLKRHKITEEKGGEIK